MDVKIKPSDLQSVVESMLRDYGDKIYVATDDGIEAAEKVLIGNLKAATPVMNPEKAPKGYKDKKLRNGWVSTGKKYRLMRFVGNKVSVQYKGKDSPLSSILEYSEKHGHPFVKKTFDESVNEMAAAVVATIKKGV
ncbi:hypothetical protein [Oscillibacter sp.]|uniref:hypothetical protein n=1 Tax=Oscillibacter sp. TaxID=1945593 RepID=UPI0028A28BD0|nr:hypothetical protein [Oscillibacter sp.]